MRPPRFGRYLAVLALVAAIVATALVVQSGLGHTSHPAAPTTNAPAPVTHRHASKRRSYVIQSGDTLSSIAVKTGVSVGELQTLNPSVTSNPNALQTGKTLRLR